METTKAAESNTEAESVISTQKSHAGETEQGGTVHIQDNEVVVNTSDPSDNTAPRSEYVTSSVPANQGSPVVPSETNQRHLVPFKYDEFDFLNEALEYIMTTYGQHYAHDIQDKGMQVFDLWEGLGSLGSTARDTAIKYLVRYGRKGGYNKKDLFKAIHYIVLLAYATKDQMDQ